MGKWSLEAGKQGLNISLSYKRDLPEVYQDEKFQNALDEVMLNPKEFPKTGLKYRINVEFDENLNIVRFYQLNGIGISEKDWKGIFTFGGDSKSDESRSLGARGQGFKVWIPILEAGKILSHHKLTREKTYSILEYEVTTEGITKDWVSPFGSESTSSVNYKPITADFDDDPKIWDKNSLGSCPLNSKFGSIWEFKLVDMNNQKIKSKMHTPEFKRLKSVTLKSLWDALPKVLYNRYYNWLNDSRIEIGAVYKQKDGSQLKKSFKPVILPGIMDENLFVRQGTLDIREKKRPFEWSGKRGKFIVDSYKIGIIKTADLKDAVIRAGIKYDYSGIHINVNNRCVRVLRRDISLSRDDYRIIGELHSNDIKEGLKIYENAIHEGFKDVEPVLHREISTIIASLKIAFDKEIGGAEMLGGSDKLTSEIATFLESYGIRIKSDIEGPKTEEDEEGEVGADSSYGNELIDIIKPPPEQKWIGTITLIPESPDEQTNEFKIEIEIINPTSSDISNYQLDIEIIGIPSSHSTLPKKKVKNINITSLNSTILLIPKWDLTFLIGLRKKLFLKAALYDDKRNLKAKKTKWFEFNRLIKDLRIEDNNNEKISDINRDENYFIKANINKSVLSLPATFIIEYTPSSIKNWTQLLASKYTNIKGVPKTFSATINLDLNDKRGRYHFRLRILDNLDSEMDKRALTINVEKMFRRIIVPVRGDDLTVPTHPMFQIRNPYDLDAKIKISIDFTSRTLGNLLNRNLNLIIKPGLISHPYPKIDINKLDTDEYILSVRLILISPKKFTNADPRYEEQIIKTIDLITDKDPDRKKKKSGLKIMANPNPTKDPAFFDDENNIIYINVLHQLFERIDSDNGISYERWKKGLAVILYYCFKGRLATGQDIKWYDFERDF